MFAPLYQEWQTHMLWRTKGVNIWGVVAYGEVENARIPKNTQIQKKKKKKIRAKEAHLQVRVGLRLQVYDPWSIKSFTDGWPQARPGTPQGCKGKTTSEYIGWVTVQMETFIYLSNGDVALAIYQVHF